MGEGGGIEDQDYHHELRLRWSTKRMFTLNTKRFVQISFGLYSELIIK